MQSKEVPEGVGPHIVTVPATADNETNKPFLLLDAREKEEFDRCHLMDAINFPVILLNRDKIDYQIMRYVSMTKSLVVSIMSMHFSLFMCAEK